MKWLIDAKPPIPHHGVVKLIFRELSRWKIVTGPGKVILLRRLLLALAPLILWFWLAQSGEVRAGPAVTSCSSITATNVVFSDYNTITKPQLQTTGTITTTCIGNAAGNANLTINLSPGNSGGCGQRDMYNGALTEKYTLFHASNYSGSWCGNFAQPVTIPAANTPFTSTFTVYAEVPSGQTLTFGDYSDTVIATTVTSGADASTSFLVTDHVPGVCSLSASPLTFGTYANAQLDGSATITVNCSNTAAYSVALDGGANLSGSTRRMVGSAAQYLAYALYSDSSRTSLWGDGSGLGNKVSGVGTGSNQTLTVYGRVSASQLVTPGSYSDTVVVTLSY